MMPAVSGDASFYAAPAPTAEPGGPPPRPGLAALLSVLLPGLGQVYARRAARALIWFGAEAGLLVVTALLARVSALFFVVGYATLGVIGVRILASVDASRVARRSERPRAGTFVVIASAIVLFVAGRGVGAATRAFVVEAFQISSGAMIPTLLAGDHVFADKRPFEPRRGDVIVFEFPENRRQDFVSRVVGMPGETVEVRDTALYIDDRKIPRCPLGTIDGQLVVVEWLDERPHLIVVQPSTSADGAWTVPEGEYFVVSDNRENAYDSRAWFGAGRRSGSSCSSGASSPHRRSQRARSQTES